MKSNLRIIEIVDSEDVMVFHNEKEIAIISKESLKRIADGDVTEVDSYRKFDRR